MASLQSSLEKHVDILPVVLLLGTTIPEAAVGGEDTTDPYRPPLALQPFHGKSVIDHWWDALTSVGLNVATHVFVITNATHYKAFEFWGLGRGLSVAHIINTGVSVGDARVDVTAVVRTMMKANASVAMESDSPTPQHDFLVIAADSAPPHTGASFQSVMRSLVASRESSVLIQPGPIMPHLEGPVVAAVTEPNEATGLTVIRDIIPSVAPAAAITGLQASPSPICYLIKSSDVCELFSNRQALHGLQRQCREHIAALGGTPTTSVPVECLLAWLARFRLVVGHTLLDNFQIGALNGSPHHIPPTAPIPAALSSLAARVPITRCAYARVGLLGNPSDGFGGKTLAVTISNFKATVTLTPSPDSSTINLCPHPLYDPHRFTNLRQLSAMAAREGYSGGLRLLQAALHRFFLHCRDAGVPLHDRGFTVRYHTTIPKQVGLAGSSAILVAFIRAVAAFYGFETEETMQSIGLGSDLLPNFVLKIENEELGITAGLQDRVVQVKQGLIHMDFAPEHMKSAGHGIYTRLSCDVLPPLFLAFAADPSDSGRIHAPVKQRWLAGDADVIARMSKIASMADIGLSLCTSRPYNAASTTADKEAVVSEWARAFSTNFNERRALFGDAALGKDNIRMIEIAREAGASAKFPGSGGAVVGVVDVAGIAAAGLAITGDSHEERIDAALQELQYRYHREGYVFTPLYPVES